MPPTSSRIELTPEETYLWKCARNWRTPAALQTSASLDWAHIVTVGRRNRMQTMLHNLFRDQGVLDRVPPAVRDDLAKDVDLIREAARRQSEGLRQCLHHSALASIETIVHKGLSLSINVYDDPTMRPGGDIDLLVRRDRVWDTVAVLERLGLGRFWPDLLDDQYYERHHLHQQRSSPDYKVWFEIHWALDHPYTLLTIDYEALMNRTTAGELMGEPVNQLSLPDLLLTLAVHLVKHAVYLPSVLDRPDLARVILADGMLVYFMDVAEAANRWEHQIDWSLTIDLAQRWGAQDILGSVLRVCEEFLAAPVPPWVLDRLPVKGPGMITERTMNRVADHQVSIHLGEPHSRLWSRLLNPEGAFIMRPIRMLDLAAYFFPDRGFLQRRYGDGSRLTAFKHLVRAAGQYTRIGFDGLYYAVKRYRRLRRQNRTPALQQVEAES